MTQLLMLNESASFTVSWITDLLRQAGLQVLPSFHLRTALTAETPCTCSHHATNCDCDMAVLLVYGSDPQPATLVTHSHNGQTWLSLSNNLEGGSSSNLYLQIESALAASNSI